MAFALYEMKVVLAELLRTARLRPVPGYHPTPVLRAITLAPSKGMMVTDRRRPPCAAGGAAGSES